MKIPLWGAFILFIAICGCGPSKRSLAERDFRQKIAAVKVACEGSTYDEFRSARLAAKTSFEANRSLLESHEAIFVAAMKTGECVEFFWRFHPTLTLIPFGESEKEDQELMAIIGVIDQNAADRIRLKRNESYGAMRADPDFLKKTYVREGLAIIKQDCEAILK